ncbi:MAG TPA: twin-arginine translocase TatA/TatE family subunit [Acidimicrobiia bacterium]|nr:twin-arginine translocase TatA/TatE family subunit [Acidimicrobiia bacterium]
MIEGGEWIVIVLVALVVFGPERLPELARRTGDWVRELRGAAREMREGLEAEIAEVKKVKTDLSDPVAEVKRAVQDTVRLAAETDPRGPNGKLRWEGPKPVSGPSPADAMADLEKIEEAGEPLTDEPEAEGISPKGEA